MSRAPAIRLRRVETFMPKGKLERDSAPFVDRSYLTSETPWRSERVYRAGSTR